jgi:hypothetical protein
MDTNAGSKVYLMTVYVVMWDPANARCINQLIGSVGGAWAMIIVTVSLSPELASNYLRRNIIST